MSAPNEFARSANGDVWLLGRDGSDIPYVVHQANLPSGGAATKMDVEAFLKREPDHPESLELIRLMGTAANAPQPEPMPRPATEPITEPGQRPMEDPPDSGPIVPTPPDSPSRKRAADPARDCADRRPADRTGCGRVARRGETRPVERARLLCPLAGAHVVQLAAGDMPHRNKAASSGVIRPGEPRSIGGLSSGASPLLPNGAGVSSDHALQWSDPSRA